MKMKCLIAMVVVISLFITAAARNVQAREAVEISTLSGPFGSGPYVINTAAQDLSRKHHPWLRIDHAESPGYIFSLKKLTKEPKLRKSMIIGSGAVLNWMAGRQRAQTV